MNVTELNEEILQEEPVNDDEFFRFEMGEAHYTDMGNSQRLAFLHGDKLRWSPALGWLQYDGIKWQQVDDTVPAGLARKVPRFLLEEAAAETENPGKRQQLAEWALESEKASAISAMVRLLRSEPGIRVETEDIDSDPWLLNVENGTLDLRTLEFLSHSPGDLLTKVSGCRYNPEAKCPRWEQFLQEVMDGNNDLIGYLQRYVGYILTGLTKEQSFLFFSGCGANGKGRFVETVAALLGDYATPFSPGALIANRNDSTNEFAALRGCRYTYCGEIEPGKTLDAALLKTLTGEDSMRVRFLYHEFFTLTPTFKVVYSANGAPKVRDSSYGFWRRCKHVPFNVSFPLEKRDKQLQEKLNEELEGILNWAINGLETWKKNGLQEPGIVTAATREYRDDQSVISCFLEEVTVKTQDPTLGMSLQKLHDYFSDWSKKNGERLISNRALKKELEALGMTTYKGNIGVMVQGIKLVDKE